MAFAYDVLRLFRRLVRHGRFAVDIEDILYWTICFLLSFTLLYYGNNGVIRFAYLAPRLECCSMQLQWGAFL